MLPLSPARQCARSYSFGMRAPFAQGHVARHARAIDQRGHDADLLGDVLARAAATRGTVRVERLDLVADDCGLLARSPRVAATRSRTSYGRASRVEGATVQRRAADEVDAQLGEAAAETLAKDLARRVRARATALVPA